MSREVHKDMNGRTGEVAKRRFFSLVGASLIDTLIVMPVKDERTV
jgi:hypothetical protein